MSLISAHDLRKSFGSKTVLDGAELTVEPRQRVGLIGPNGAGKSTLLSILVGRLEPDAGNVLRRRGLRMAVVDQDPKLDPARTVRDTLASGMLEHRAAQAALETLQEAFEGASGAVLDSLLAEHALHTEAIERLGGYDLEHRLEAMRDALSLPAADRIVQTLSLGERRRLAIALGLLEAPELLVLDEPTNHLDVSAIEWLETELNAFPGAVLLVTHDRYFLDRVSTRMAELDRGRLYLYEGNYTEYMVLKAERAELEARTQHNIDRAITSELTWVRASAPARTTKQKARLERFDALVGSKKDLRVDQVSLRLPYPARMGKTILEIENVSKAYDARALISGLSLLLKKGDRIGIVGPNGAGKSTLVRMIMGEVQPDSGQIVIGQNTEIIYADQARSTLDDERTVIEEVAGGNDRVQVGDDWITVFSFLEKLLFSGADQQKKVSALSGGERSRVALAKHLRVAGNLIILDEPTNDLDLPTLRVLEEGFAINYPGCVLVISHDRYFLDRVATAILAFEGGGKVTLYEGDYAAFRARSSGETAPGPSTTPKAKEQRTKEPAKKKRSFKEQREYEEIEATISTAEAEVARLELELSDPEIQRKLKSELPARLAALESARKKVERLYARWQELEAKSS